MAYLSAGFLPGHARASCESQWRGFLLAREGLSCHRIRVRENKEMP